MRRNIAVALAIVHGALVWSVAGQAQISFIPSLQRSVPNGPTFVAGGDFNGDNINDVVVSSTIRDRVTVLLGTPDGTPGTPIEVPVGALLRGVAVGDLNGDGRNDIAVADFSQNRLFVVFGRGDGTFASPQGFATARRGPVWVALGNFDNRPGLDAATANGAADSFSVLVNEGGNRGLRLAGNFPVGSNSNPRVILAHDLNGDRIDDLMLLDTGTRGTDEVSVFLNTGTGSFSGVIPQRFVVGIDAIGMAKGDFNNDGRIDLAVLNRQLQQLNRFSISILLGSESPLFRVLPPIEFSCPSRINGIEVFCTPQDIAAADFDLDTRTDLAVSFSTRATDNSQTTAGFVTVYAGLGDGRFEFGTQVIVGLGPRRIAAMDFTGDAVPDIAVAEFSNNSVRILRGKEPPRRPNGASCVVGRQCESNACVDNVCCATPSCPEGQRCDVLPPNSSILDGVCRPPAPNGNRCTSGEQCQSRRCVDGFCCASAACPQGQFCNTGTCGPPASNGVPCNAGEQCASGNCTDGVCCADPQCAVNAACNIPGSEGVCTTRRPIGSPCTDPAQCCTDATDPTRCDPSFCIEGFCCERACGPNETCSLPGFEGLCMPKPTPTPTPPFTPTPKAIGDRCVADSECISGFCVDFACCRERSCPAGQTCSFPGSAGTCTNRGNNGSVCDGNEDCNSGFCRLPVGGSLGVCDNPPPTPTPTPVPPGRPCSDTLQCTGGFFCNLREGGICCNLDECPANMSCRVPGQEGFCNPIPPTPTPRKRLGDECIRAEECESLACVHRVCCETAECPPAEEPERRCDITGFEGFCVPPLGVDEPCRKNSDCLPPNVCQQSGLQLVCGPPPTPTLPLPTPPIATPTPDIQTEIDRSGGCQIDGEGGSLSWWPLGFLTGLLWLRRRQSARVRIC